MFSSHKKFVFSKQFERDDSDNFSNGQKGETHAIENSYLTNGQHKIWPFTNLNMFIESILSCLDGYKPIYHNIDETDISLLI